LVAYNKKNRGSALITALFIMALIAAAATALIYEQQLTIATAQQNFNTSQAVEYNQVVTDWAVDQLQQDLLNATPTALVDSIPALYPTTAIPGGNYRGALFDLQDKFNLNNLISPAKAPGFINLLKNILPEQQDPTVVANAIINYISPRGKFDASYDDAYRKANLPYTPPHRPMLNISELRKVIGITAPLYQALTPYVTALPQTNTPLNINTSSLPVLMSLAPDISLDTAKAIAMARPYKTATDINSNPVIENHDGIAAQLTTTSSFFVARSLIEIDRQQLLMSNYIYRNANDKTTAVMWQTQGSSE